MFRWKNVACWIKVQYVGTGLLLDLYKHGCGLFRPCINVAVVFSGQEWASEEGLQGVKMQDMLTPRLRHPLERRAFCLETNDLLG